MNSIVALLESVNPFLLLLIAIACEITGTTALRVSEGFTKLFPSIWVAVSYVLSFYLYALVLKHMPMGIAYVIWGGLGGVGVVLIGMIIWRDSISLWQVVGMVLIALGVVMLNVLTPTTS
jgi:multidrug transporter EmrE-like cation transporter